MKTIVRNAISVLFMMSLISVYATMPSGAQTSGPSASGNYTFQLEDEISKSVQFTATTDERGATTGQMTFRDEAGVVDHDPDEAGGAPERPQSEFYMTANLDSLTIDRNRALMGGTVTDSSNRSYIGKWVQLVVEDNGDGSRDPDKVTWCFCKPEEGGWVPADEELRNDEGAWWRWLATDAELKDDVGIQSPNIIPGNKTSCKVLPLPVYQFAEVRSSEGQVQVQP